jgi:hypothetical protein
MGESRFFEAQNVASVKVIGSCGTAFCAKRALLDDGVHSCGKVRRRGTTAAAVVDQRVRALEP